MFGSRPQPPRLASLGWIVFLITACLLWAPVAVVGDERSDCRELLATGKYAQCILRAAEAIQARRYGEDWPLMKARAELATGRYRDAQATIHTALKRYGWSIRLRLTGYRAELFTSGRRDAQEMLREIDTLAERYPWRYGDTEDLVVLGKAALLLGADARNVLEGFFDRARREVPDHRAPLLASGQLALDKNDFPLAAEIWQQAARQFPDDAEVQFGLAQALAATAPERSAAALKKALALNPQHVPAMLQHVDKLVDAERYAQAENWLDKALYVNPRHPQAWAYRSLLAHLNNDPRGAAVCRAAALARWNKNPAVDHLIGRKLAHKYRFAESAAHQRRALEFDPQYLPARIQLAEDLLRLGEEAEGWQLAESVHDNDRYDVVAFNLVELRDKIDRFRTLEDDTFILRMHAREADVYGDQVLALLQRAKTELCKKYGLNLPNKVTVEIFPEPDDFAVRTFGMPSVSGYLGVCFGRVITANSPVSHRDNPSNWQAVLWHEFCHVVTLQLTRNRIPRWLSEGISVYEERQADPTWGQRMNPRYRQMVLGGEVTPLGRLSAAFHSPQTPLHLQFAYYESALAVEFLIGRYGLAALKSILHDLGAGLPINTALSRHTVPLAELEPAFEQFVTQRARALAPQADWTRPDLAALLKDDDPDVLERWMDEHPNNFLALTAFAEMLIERKEWHRAETVLEKLISLYPGYTGADNAYEMLAAVHRAQENERAEQKVLTQYAEIDADALPVFLRLIELGTAAEDWPLTAANAQRALAVDPMIPRPYRAAAQAAERLENTRLAIDALRALLRLGASDPAGIHYRLARHLRSLDDPQATRHVLCALEEAPRYRAAHRLLLEISGGKKRTRESQTNGNSQLSGKRTSQEE